MTGRDYRLFQDTPAWELAKAVRDENETAIKEIIKRDTGIINYQEPKYGNTLLILTVMNQQFKPFKLLLDNNADITIHNTFSGNSAIIESVSLKLYDIKFVRMLIEAGANVNDIETGVRKEYNYTRKTPLMSAVSSGRIDFIRLLLENGADVNYYNEFGQSAFSKSVLLSKYDISYLLLLNGANYKKPIFYRPDFSIPSEKRDPKDKGTPIYLVDALRECVFDFNSEEYKYKMLIVDFLKSKGIDYHSTPVPEYIKQKIKDKYPNTWQMCLEKY